jgi:hypothetical protein
MRRRTLDLLASSIGLVLALVLVLAGGLLGWAHNFIGSQVRDQLTAQKIYFPPAGSAALKPAAIGPYLNQYAGQQLVNGDQAKAYADHFIAVHLSEVANGQTYAQVSTAALAAPNNAALQAQKTTLFQGTTLRGMLLNAYAFWTMGKLAGIAAIVSFVAAGVLLLLSILGFVHARRTSPEAVVLGAHVPAPVEA